MKGKKERKVRRMQSIGLIRKLEVANSVVATTTTNESLG